MCKDLVVKEVDMEAVADAVDDLMFAAATGAHSGIISIGPSDDGSHVRIELTTEVGASC